MTQTVDRPVRREDEVQLAADFHRNGWVKVPQLVSSTDLERMQDAAAEIAKRTSRPKSGRDGFDAEAGSDEFQHTMRILSQLRVDFPIVLEVAHKIAPLAAKALGVRSLRLWTDNLFIKPGRDFGSNPTIWHQDSPKIPTDRRGVINAWIAVYDVPISRGAMAFVSGSHRLGSLGAIEQLGHGDPDLTELLTNEDWDQITGCASAPLVAGDATFHHGMTLHRAHRNVDEPDRVGMAIHMIDADARFTGAASRHTDALNMQAFGPFADEAFPVLC